MTARRNPDPLADLRSEDTFSLPDVEAVDSPPVDPRVLLIQTWHADPTACAFIHGSGGCGCRYLAEIALPSGD